MVPTKPGPALGVLFLFGWLACLPLQAAEPTADVTLLPPEVVLNGPTATQRLILEQRSEHGFVGDETAKAAWVSSNPNVARVDEQGVVRAVGDGSAQITATAEGRSTTTTVHVKHTKTPFTWSFRNDVIPVLTKTGCNSGACHGAAAGKNGFKLTLRGYDPAADFDVLTRQALARRIDRVEPAQSLMLRKATQAVVHGGGLRFDDQSLEYRILVEWIAAGTPPPADHDPRVQFVEAFPKEVILKPGQIQQIVVRAGSSDGTKRDVTPWVKYASSDVTVATVDDATGEVTVKGPGEAAITAWYSSHVTFTRIIVPYPATGDATAFATSPRHNFIDDLVLKKLQSLNIPPSPECSEGALIRRAYLDLLGVLPTAEEVEAFLKDSTPDKRTRLIDALLQRPEYADYWAYKWSDVLLVSSRKLQTPAMWAFYNHIHKGVAENKPWDQFARDILTASGSTLENGAANYFVLHKDPIDLTETTSVAFLGMSITCAHCHNHPLEKWTQNDYYGMANLFSRVRMKNGDSRGELIVYATPVGDIDHPRTGKPLPPKPLDGQPLPVDFPGDRRVHLAQWLTAPENPYFARALVNRVWRNFLGRGLVEAEDDLRLTNPPSNTELLDTLAKDFATHGFDVQRLIRLIMASATYQRSAQTIKGNEQDQKFYSRNLVKRLPAEVLLDAYSQVTGAPTDFPGYPKGFRSIQLPDVRVNSYFLDAFGRPQRMQTCACERQQEPSMTQALHLANGDTLNQKLRAKDNAIDKLLSQNPSDERILVQVFLASLARYPTDAEKQRVLPVLAEAAREKDALVARRQAVEDLFWAVLTGKEFLFNH